MQGLSDLANHRIRTPLPPLQTFQDDPLRILRCLRFASRFGYELDEELKESLKDEGILVSMRNGWGVGPGGGGAGWEADLSWWMGG